MLCRPNSLSDERTRRQMADPDRDLQALTKQVHVSFPEMQVYCDTRELLQVPRQMRDDAGTSEPRWCADVELAGWNLRRRRHRSLGSIDRRNSLTGMIVDAEAVWGRMQPSRCPHKQLRS
jgi:hypothetical protein